MGEDFPLLQVPLWIDLAAIGSGALAGAANALRERFDLIGVLLMAIVMGLGGGIIRDLLLGLRPVAVTNEAYLVTAVAAGLASIVLLRLVVRWVQLFSLFDALALGLFTIVGVEKASLNGLPAAGAVLVGVAAGVGGGVIRDVVSGRPVEIVLRGSWNATAALAGALLFLVLRALVVPIGVAEVSALVVIVAARLASLHFGLQTPEIGDVLARVRRPARRRPAPGDDRTAGDDGK